MKSYDAPAAIGKYRIVKFNTATGAKDRQVAQAAAAADLLIGEVLIAPGIV